MRLLERLTQKGSHCAVEWNEPGNPQSVVLTKTVSGVGGDGFEVGDECNVRVREGGKMVVYKATVIGCGECCALCVDLIYTLVKEKWFLSLLLFNYCEQGYVQDT